MACEKRILLLGDSLFAGYLTFADFAAPGPELSRLLAEKARAAGRDTRYVVKEIAVPGITTRELLAEMKDALYHDGDSAAPHQLFDVAVVLCGTNDLGMGKPIAQIHANLTSIYDAARQYTRAHVVACTIPASIHTIADLVQERVKLNALVTAGKETVLDLYSVLGQYDTATEAWSPAHPDTMSLWNADGLHFSPRGYARIAAAVADCIAQHGLLYDLL
eukprot:m.28038 g.28038  ORF g.28038 m.28038 type:complete len:219 (+) comp4489_c0_seq1:34-690(+)